MKILTFIISLKCREEEADNDYRYCDNFLVSRASLQSFILPEKKKQARYKKSHWSSRMHHMVLFQNTKSNVVDLDSKED